jgi:putative peptidoglycan lipid II flippase
VQWPALGREGFRYRPVFDASDPVLRDVARLTLPALAGLAAVQVNLFVNSWLATGLGTGAVSWLDYAFRLMYMPIGLFGISIATASLPGISTHAAANDVGGLRETLSSGVRMMLMLNVPATFGLITLASPIVQLIFERGRFTSYDTASTAAALACYAPGLVGYSLVKLVSPVFYALGESRVPVVTSAASIALNIVLNLLLVGSLGHRGLALGTAIAALANGAALMWIVRRRLGGLDGRQLSLTFVKIGFASVLMAAAVYATELLLAAAFAGPSIMAGAVRVFGAIGIGLLTLSIAAHALRIEEFREAVRVFRARLAGAPAH